MTKAQLLDVAASLGLDLPASTKKADIVKAIIEVI